MNCGYGYGVWIQIEHPEISTEHISHVTIACFMQKKDAIELYKDLIQEVGPSICMEIVKKGQIFDDNTEYPEDKNDIIGWGYYCKSVLWETIKDISEKYKCNFSYYPHISVEYKKYICELHPFDLESDIKLYGKIVPVNINGSNPKMWNILSKREIEEEIKD